MTSKILKNSLSTALESYLEEIKTLQEQYGAVRVTDLAKRMKRRLPSVTSALRRLSQFGLINYETYRPVTLSPLGEATVRKLDGRHRVLADFFLTVLALSEEIADEEACRLEHRVSPAILRRLSRFMEFLRHDPETVRTFFQEKRFHDFLKPATSRQSGDAGRSTGDKQLSGDKQPSCLKPSLGGKKSSDDKRPSDKKPPSKRKRLLHG
ncbi:MAG: metal-dependent transcriptional regulator [Candidatus Ozemobacteraceae bacterium]